MSTTSHDDFMNQFKAKVEGNAADMYWYALYLCRDRELAKDLVQDAFLNIYKSGTPALTFKTYALKCVHNLYLDYLRTPKGRTGRLEVGLPEDDGNRLFRTGDEAAETVTSLDIRSALLQLEDEDRALIFFRYYLGYGVAVAVRMATGLTNGAAYRRHQAVLDLLRAILTTEEAKD